MPNIKKIGMPWYIFLCLCLPQCSGRVRLQKKKIVLSNHAPVTCIQTNQPPPITIWIHGTRFFYRPVFNYFFSNTPGLKLAYQLDKHYHLRTVVDTLHRYAPALFPCQSFYLFGWSGKLNAYEREAMAHVLNDELKKLTTAYKAQYHRDPFIRIIAHSHGGNVALNLTKTNDPIAINELILLACPAQRSMMETILNPMFKKVFVLYSSLDFVQVIAPDIRHIAYAKNHTIKLLKIPPLSARRFPIKDTILQVKIKLNGRALFHGEFVEPYFLMHLPNILQTIDQWNYEKEMNTAERLLCVQTYSKKFKKI